MMILIRLKRQLIGLLLLPVMPLFALPESSDDETPDVQRARERLEGARERERRDQERNVANSATQRALERAEENLQRTQRRDAQDRAQGLGRYGDGTIHGNPDLLSSADLVSAIERINELPPEERLAGLNSLGDLTGLIVVNSEGQKVDAGEWLATHKTSLTESKQRSERGADLVSKIQEINKLPPEERLTHLNSLVDLTGLKVVNSEGQEVDAGEWVTTYKKTLANTFGGQLPEEMVYTPPQATHTSAYPEGEGSYNLDWSGDEAVKSARANLVRQGYNVYGLSGEQIVGFSNQVLQAKIAGLGFEDGTGEDEAGPYVGAGNFVGNVVRNPDGGITSSGGTPAAELNNPATPNLYELAEQFGYDPEAHSTEELVTLVDNRIAADTAIRDRQIKELASQSIQILGDEYTDDMDALTDLELVQHWQLRSQRQQVRSRRQQAWYEQNLPHFGAEARNWLMRLGVKGAGLMTDEEAIAEAQKSSSR